MKYLTKSFVLAQCLFTILTASLFFPNEKTVEEPWAFLTAILLIEGLFLFRVLRGRNQSRDNGDPLILVWLVLLLWEILTSKLDLLHPVLFPAPENVFLVFAEQRALLLEGVISSIGLLFSGMVFGIFAGVCLGLVAGWIPRIRSTMFPVAQVLSPVSPVIYAPYLIALMPTFRSASFLVLFLGIFWPTLLNTILRVDAIESRLVDSARALNVNDGVMICEILLPYVLPGVVSGLRVTMTSSVMMLTFAEMMGATSGMGYYIINYAHYANYTNVVAGIIVVGIVVTLLNRLVGWIQYHSIKWR